MATSAGAGAVRIDDFFFTEYVANSCAAVHHDEDDEAHSGMTKTARDFLKKKFGTISRFYSNITTADTADVNGFSRINTLRKALAALDRGGWERSYHQRIFHESFLNSVVRVLFKTDPPGFFERSYPRLLEMNTWQSINQEILISTPRRFGKTISVCLFVAALVFACPNVEISIYSTCKRISQKLLRNCVKFLSIIHDVLKIAPMEYIKQSSDEIDIRGPESKYDSRKINSYPSKLLSGCYLGFYGAHTPGSP